MHLSDRGKKFLYGLIAVVVLAIIYMLLSSPERFDTVKGTNEVTVPSLYDKESGTLMSGSQFLGVPPEVATAWGSVYGDTVNGDKPEMNNPNNDIDFNTVPCSRSCCSPQYPPPFDLPVNDGVDGSKYQSNNMFCNNNLENSACLCLTPSQSDWLASRGNNCKGGSCGL